jgi:hypothetical protein
LENGNEPRSDSRFGAVGVALSELTVGATSDEELMKVFNDIDEDHSTLDRMQAVSI